MSIFLSRLSLLLFLSVGFSAGWVQASDQPAALLKLKESPRDGQPLLAPASPEAARALKRFKSPAGFTVDLFAAEPMLANPVAFCLDEQGRVFVSETHRFNTSVLDIRHYMSMLEDDVACQSLENRLQLTQKYFGAEAKQLAQASEIVRLLQDRNHDGKADVSSVYADGFNSALDGIASGVLARRGQVWFANIPEITLLKGIDREGRAKSRESFSRGYGVRFNYTGHDLHGLIFGPDGKLYFSFGDRGANVKTKEGKTLFFPDEGAVFRCNPDGTEMEVVHRGLRNPQELAFDEFGNLFTGDNDFDHGDKERWVYVVEGGDSGWRVGYQHPPLGYDLVPWKADRLWMPHFEGQPAYIVPPIANLDDGPSGLVYYPGTGLPAKYDGHFFLCHFKGNLKNSGIRSFTVEPKGASFEMGESQQFIWNVEATDVDFGPDSRLYFSDWGEGWAMQGKGRIYRVSETNSINDPVVRETQKLIANGFGETSQKDLLKLLAHPNMKVRTEAQFTLAERGKDSVKPLAKLSANISASAVARRHAIWALGQIARKNPSAIDSLIPLLADTDAEIRAQSSKVLGDAKATKAFNGLVKLLRDENLRVRFFAAQSLGKLGRRDAVEPLFAMLRENDNRDIYLRHAGAFALSRCSEKAQLLAAAKNNPPAVRLAVLLAMRHLEYPEIAGFLHDENEMIVVEAARAINDVPIKGAFQPLAALLSQDRKFAEKHDSQFQALQLRVINANFHLGTSESASNLARFAAHDSSPAIAAEEALNLLAMWAEPGRRDRVVGNFRQYRDDRKSQDAATALQSVVDGLVTGNRSDPIKLAAINAIVRLQLTSATPSLYQVFSGTKDSEKVRLQALKALEDLKYFRLIDAAKLAQADSSELIRKEGNRLVALIKPDDAIPQIESVLEKGSLIEKQGALTSLASIPGAEADAVLSKQLDLFQNGKLPGEIVLELFEAIRSRPALAQKLRQSESKISGHLKGFHETLFGGNAEAGRKIFFERPEASCVRCHKIGNEGGEVGPLLTTIGGQKSRADLLEALVQPNAKIAPGFETLLVVMKNGASYSGVFKSEDEKELVLNSLEDGLVKIAKAEIKTRDQGKSGMPDGLGELLTKREIRDLIEYLATLK